MCLSTECHCASCEVHSKSVRALVTRALATIINLGKPAVLVKVLGCAFDCYLGAQLPAMYNGSYGPRERTFTIICLWCTITELCRIFAAPTKRPTAC